MAPSSVLFMLADDIGWADLGYNGGVAHTPHLDAWAADRHSITLMDMHSGGTVCSPTQITWKVCKPRWLDGLLRPLLSYLHT